MLLEDRTELLHRAQQMVGVEFLRSDWYAALGGRRFDLGTGDSFRIRGEPYRWANPHDVDAVVIWVIAPPVY